LKLKYIVPEDAGRLAAQVNETAKVLSGLISSLEKEG